MQAFAALLDALSYQPARNAKLRLIETYLRETPDPDRGWALAALTGGLDFPAAKPALLRGFGEDKIGPELFHLSYDYVGDLAETLALIWETDPGAGPPPALGEVVETLQRATKTQTPARRPASARSSRRCSAPPRCRPRRSSSAGSTRSTPLAAGHC